MVSKIAVVTIGQAPRKDMASDMRQLKNTGLDVTEFGILDLLSMLEIEALAPNAQDTDILVTLLTNGQQVKLSKKKLLPLVEKRMLDLQEFTWILLMCTGDFANALTAKNLLLPDRMLTYLIQGIRKDVRLGLIGPEPEQRTSVTEKWQKANFEFTFAASSPYHFDKHDLLAKAKLLEQQGAELLILDCMGYSNTMKNHIKNELNIPVIVPREAILNILTTIH